MVVSCIPQIDVQCEIAVHCTGLRKFISSRDLIIYVEVFLRKTLGWSVASRPHMCVICSLMLISK